MTFRPNARPRKRYGWLMALAITLLLCGFQFQYDRIISIEPGPTVAPPSAAPALKQSCKFPDFQSIQKHLRWAPGRKVPLILAHRGGPTDVLPENALETLLHTAAQLPCPILEFDVRMTRDSVLVIAHDDALEGHTNATGLISQKNWNDLRAVKLLTHDKKTTSLPIATFKDILAGCSDKGILAVDAKPGTDLDKVIAAIAAHQAMNQSFLICYSIKDALYVSQRYPNLMLAIGFNKAEDIPTIRQSGLPLDRLIALTPRTLQPKSYYDQIHRLGIVCSMGTHGERNLDEQPMTMAASGYKALINSGVDIITTNRPVEVVGLFR